jgi:hypothetical protein
MNATGQILLENAIGKILYGESMYLVLVKQGEGNEKLSQFFATNIVCQCFESQLEFVCLN